MFYFLDKNYKDFNEANIMEHPALLVGSVNRFNVRINCRDKFSSYAIYRYFSTVVYVATAYANGLTKDINNYGQVRSFFAKK